jgi:hypothetical protein
MLILEVLDTKQNDLWDTENIRLPTETAFDAIEKSFNLYSISSSILAVQQ